MFAGGTAFAGGGPPRAGGGPSGTTTALVIVAPASVRLVRFSQRVVAAAKSSNAVASMMDLRARAPRVKSMSFPSAFVTLRDHWNRPHLRRVRHLVPLGVPRASREDEERLLV